MSDQTTATSSAFWSATRPTATLRPEETKTAGGCGCGSAKAETPEASAVSATTQASSCCGGGDSAAASS